MDTAQKIRDDKALEAPFTFEDIAQQVGVVATPFTVEAVVGAHDRGDPGIHNPFEMGQIYFPQSSLINPHVDFKAGVLDAIAGKMLDTGHNVALHTPGQGRPHLAQVVWIFPVGLLAAPPGWMAQQVDADPTEEISALGPGLDPDRRADPLFQFDVPTGAPAHRHRETGRLADHDPARPVCEGQRRDAQPGLGPSQVGPGIVVAGQGVQIDTQGLLISGHLVDFLAQGHASQQRLGLLLVSGGLAL